MTTVVSIVEGHGDVPALPVLLRRIAAAVPATVTTPIRVKRDSFLQDSADGTLYRSRYLALARDKAGEDGLVLVLLDADDDCAAQLTARWVAELKGVVTPIPLALVFAVREFEAWFIGGTESLGGPAYSDLGTLAEQVSDAKGWVRERVFGGRAYSPTVDQPSLAARFDWEVARARCPSLDKLCRELAHAGLLAV